MPKHAILAAVAILAACAAPQELTLEEVLQHHYESIGGVEAWQSLESMKVTGVATLPGPGGLLEAQLTMYTKRPRKQRVEISVQDMTAIHTFDGEDGWTLFPDMGQTEPTPMPDEIERQMRQDADIDGPLVGYAEEGVELDLVGTARVEGRRTYEIRVTNPGGAEQLYYLDARTFLPVRVETRGTDAEGDLTSVIRDYRDVGGLVMAHSIHRFPRGMPEAGQTMTIQHVELNPDLPDSLFNIGAAR